jgi:hypothetical protein
MSVVCALPKNQAIVALQCCKFNKRVMYTVWRLTLIFWVKFGFSGLYTHRSGVDAHPPSIYHDTRCHCIADFLVYTNKKVKWD